MSGPPPLIILWRKNNNNSDNNIIKKKSVTLSAEGCKVEEGGLGRSRGRWQGEGGGEWERGG